MRTIVVVILPGQLLRAQTVSLHELDGHRPGVEVADEYNMISQIIA